MDQVLKGIVTPERTKFDWINWVHVALLALMLVLVFWNSRYQLNPVFPFLGIVLFTIWNIVSLIRDKIKGNQIYAEEIIFALIFVGYSLLSLSLALYQVRLISVVAFVYSILLSTLALYGLAFFIWSWFFIKNKRNSLLLILNYVMLTTLIIFLFVGFYAAWGNFSLNGQIVQKNNMNTFDYVYYSGTIFTGIGNDYSPLDGNTKSIMLTESYLSMIFNVVVVSVVLSRFIFK